MTQPDPTAEAAARQKEQEKEYGTYVAVNPIMIGNALAFNTGDPVPAGHVERGVVSSEDVAKVGTKSANAATGTVAPVKTESGK